MGIATKKMVSNKGEKEKREKKMIFLFSSKSIKEDESHSVTHHYQNLPRK